MPYSTAVFALSISRVATRNWVLQFHPEESDTPREAVDQYSNELRVQDGEKTDQAGVMKAWLRQTFRMWQACRESTSEERNRLVPNYQDMFFGDHQQQYQEKSLPKPAAASSSSSLSVQSTSIPPVFLPPPLGEDLNVSVAHLFRLQSDAIDRLRSFDSDFFGQLIDGARKLLPNVELMIGGSAGVAATLLKADFTPNDMDLYMKDISNAKITALDALIRQLRPLPTTKKKKHKSKDTVDDEPSAYKVVIVRKPLTLTWILTNKLNVVHRVQLCLMKVGSWSDVFSVYHSDIVSTGFDIARNHFVVFYPRWRRLLHALTRFEPPTEAEELDNSQNHVESDARMAEIDADEPRSASGKKKKPTAGTRAASKRKEPPAKSVEVEESAQSSSSSARPTKKTKKSPAAPASVSSSASSSINDGVSKHVAFSNRYADSPWRRQAIIPDEEKMRLVYLSNFLNLDTGSTLYSAGEKYDGRHFHLDLIKAKDPDLCEDDLPLSEEMSLSSPLWDLEEVCSSYHPLDDGSIIAPLVTLQRSSLYKIGTQVADLLIEESQAPVPEILMMRWIGTPISEVNEFLKDDPVGAHEDASLLALPWQIGHKYRGRYASSFITAPLTLATQDLILQNMFQAKSFFYNVAPSTPSQRDLYRRGRRGDESAKSGDLPVGADRYGLSVRFPVPPRKHDHRRYVPDGVRLVDNTYRFTYYADDDHEDDDDEDGDDDDDDGDEEEEDNDEDEESEGEKPVGPGQIRKPPSTKFKLKTQAVQCAMMYNAGQITRVLLDLDHMTHDTTDERWPWLVWYFHRLYHQYREESIATFKKDADDHMVADLVGVAASYL